MSCCDYWFQGWCEAVGFCAEEEESGSVFADYLEGDRGGDFDWERFGALIDKDGFLCYFWGDEEREEERRL